MATTRRQKKQGHQETPSAQSQGPAKKRKTNPRKKKQSLRGSALISHERKLKKEAEKLGKKGAVRKKYKELCPKSKNARKSQVVAAVRGEKVLRWTWTAKEVQKELQDMFGNGGAAGSSKPLIDDFKCLQMKSDIGLTDRGYEKLRAWLSAQGYKVLPTRQTLSQKAKDVTSKPNSKRNKADTMPLINR
jgi:hypothetical protein